MSTNDMIKKMRNTKQITSSQQGVEPIQLKPDESVLDKISEELEKLDKLEDTPTRRFVEQKLATLQQSIILKLTEENTVLRKQLQQIRTDINAIKKVLEPKEADAEEKKSFWERFSR